jgi:hypothetical protein
MKGDSTYAVYAGYSTYAVRLGYSTYAVRLGYSTYAVRLGYSTHIRCVHCYENRTTDTEIAKKTNPMPTLYENDDPNQKINDISTFFLEELKVYLHTKWNADLFHIISYHITRNFIKVLFMPMRYGKTIINMSNNLDNHFCTLLGVKGNASNLHLTSISSFKMYFRV